MADMDSIGYVALQVIPTVSGLGSNLSQGFNPLVQAGARAGRDTGQALVTGVQAAQAQVESAARAMAKSQDKVADAAGKVRVAETKLQELRNSGRATATQLATAEERLEAARRNAASATRDGVSATDRYTEAQERAANATDEVVRSGNGLGGAFSGLGGGIKQIAALTTGAAGLSGAFALVGQAVEKEMGADKLAASLGAGPELAKEYGAAASKAYAEGAGSSLGEVQQAVGLVQSSFSTLGFEGDLNIDQAATAALSFADIFDTDISSAVQAASSLVTTGLADGSEQAFDLMTASFQKVPAAMRDELPEIIQEYGTNFRALGFDGEESFNLLVAAAGQGKFALDKTGDALKEFTIRGSDMSKASVGTYESIGLDAELMATRIAAGGDQAQIALQETAAGLLTIEDPAQRANAAIALFGTPLEDLSVDQIPAFLSGLAGAEPAMAGFEGALGDASATMYDNFGSKMEVLKRGFQDTFVNLVGDDVLPLLGDFSGALEENEGNALAAVAGMAGLGGAVAGFETAKGTFDSVSEGIGSVKDGFMSVKDTATQAWEGAKKGIDFAKSAASATADFAKTSAAAVVNAGKTTAAWVASSARTVAAVAAQGAAFVAQKTVLVASTVATAAATAAQWALNLALNANPISLIIIAVTALVAGLVYFFTQTELGKTIITAAWEGIKTAISFAWESVIKPTFNFLVEGVKAIGDGAMWLWNNAIVPAFDGIKAAIGFAWDLISGYFNLWKSAFTAIGDGATWLWNNAIVPAFDGIKNAIGTVVGFLEPLWERFKSGLSAIGDMASSVGSGIKTAFSGVVGVIKQPINMVGRLLQKVPSSIFGFDIPGVGAIKEWGTTLANLRTGGVAGLRNGVLYGPGTGTSDSILGMAKNGVATARVSAGEFVTNAKATAENLPLLRAINSGALSLGDLMAGKFTAGIRTMFGLEEDDPRIKAALGIGDLLRGTFSRNSREALGVEEDNPLVTAYLNMRDRLSGLVGFAGGGVVEGMTEWVKATTPELQMTSGYRNTDNGHHSTGHAADFSNGYGNTDEQLALAKAIAEKYPNSRELIYDDPRFQGQEIKDGQKVDSSFYDEAGDHTNHVHWAMDEAPSMANAGGALGDADTSAALAGSPTSAGGTTSPGTAGGVGATSGAGGGNGTFRGSSATTSGGSFTDEAGAIKISEGNAVPVWIVNWPEGIDFEGGTASSAGASAGTPTGTTGGGTPTADGGAAPDALSGTTGGPSANLSAQDAVIAEFAKKGWGAETPEWAAAEWIIGKESSWKLDARNPESGAFGLFQFLGSTKDQYLPDESMDPMVQGAAGAQYIEDRYGDPLKAKAFWEENGWYDQGGLASGKGIMLKNVIQPEAVLSPEETKAWTELVPMLTTLVPALKTLLEPAGDPNRAILEGAQTTSPDAAAMPTEDYTMDAPTSSGNSAQNGAFGVDLSDGLASLPDIEAAQTGDPNVDKWSNWAAGLGNDVKNLFNKENLKEMLGTAVGLGLGGVGMAKYGGGDQINITEAQNGRDTARAVSRVQRRRAIAQQRQGGFGR